MSASMTTTDHRMALQAMPGGLAGWLHRTIASPAVAAAACEAATQGEEMRGEAMRGEHVYATAWPVRRDAELTMYRCRMWDGLRASDPFFVRAPHGFLGTDPVMVLAMLATVNEDAFHILRRAELRGFAVEFNQEQHGTATVSSALARLSDDTAPVVVVQ